MPLLRRTCYTCVTLEIIEFEWLAAFEGWVLEQANRKGRAQVAEFYVWWLPKRAGDSARTESSDKAAKDELPRRAAQPTPADFEESAAIQRTKKDNVKDNGGNQGELGTEDRYRKDAWDNSDWKKESG